MATASKTTERSDATSVPDAQTITDAYLYLLARALVIRQEHHDLAEAGVDYNLIKYNPLGSADFVNPNFDVAYLEAWIAVDDRTPALLEVPAITGRYYTAEILDEWAEVIVNINDRTFPSRPSGTFVLLAPGSQASIPPGAGAITLHSNKAKMLARVELKGDPNGAVELQKQFKLRSLGTPAIAKPPTMPDFDNKDLIGAAIFDDVETVLASALDVSPVAAEMQQTAEVIYFATTRDAEGKALDGSSHYVIHFPAGKLPGIVVNSYWSVILVGVPDYRVVRNSLNRYNFNSYSPLKTETDGSLKIAIGPTPVPGVAESNWLPAPEGKPFSLTFRTYVPKEIVKQEWAPPAVTAIRG